MSRKNSILGLSESEKCVLIFICLAELSMALFYNIGDKVHMEHPWVREIKALMLMVT